MIEASQIQRADQFEALTPRERQVLAMAATGMTNQQVATGLSVSIHAIKFHLATIYRKLGVSNRTEASFLYLKHFDVNDPTSLAHKGD